MPRATEIDIADRITPEYLEIVAEILREEHRPGEASDAYMVGMVSALAWKDGWTPDPNLVAAAVRVPTTRDRIERAPKRKEASASGRLFE